MMAGLTREYFFQNGLGDIDSLYNFAHSVSFGWIDIWGGVHKGINDAGIPYWFEPFMETYSGIHQYENITELLTSFCSTFLKISVENGNIPQDYDKHKLRLFRYSQPPYHINGFAMRKHVDQGTLVANVL